jgi:hypothetical protein
MKSDQFKLICEFQETNGFETTQPLIPGEFGARKPCERLSILSAYPVHAAPRGICSALSSHGAFGLLSAVPQQIQPHRTLLGHLENHWNGALLDSVDAVLQYARTMTWKGKPPVFALVTTTYQTGVKLTKEAMGVVESQIQRLPSLEKCFEDIKCSSPAIRDD